MADELAQWVNEAAGRQDVRRRVGELYARLQVEIDKRRPLCVVSGRCCKFDEFGHRLYVTTLELAAFVAGLGEMPARKSPNSDKGGCPFQAGKLCTVHQIRPFGCRNFFCDATSTDWQQQQYERFHSELKQMHGELAVPYAYVEWRQALHLLGFAGLSDDPGRREVGKEESF